jgi:hypothetical protein
VGDILGNRSTRDERRHSRTSQHFRRTATLKIRHNERCHLLRTPCWPAVLEASRTRKIPASLTQTDGLQHRFRQIAVRLRTDSVLERKTPLMVELRRVAHHPLVTFYPHEV